jgi:hypothetical protein
LRKNSKTLQQIGSGFRYDRHDAAGGAAVQCAQAVLLKAEFLHGVRVREGQVHTQIRIVVGTAIERVVHAAGSIAVDGGALLIRVDAAKAVEPAVPRGHILRAGREKHQVLRSSAVQRQFGDALFVNELPHGRVPGTDHFRGGRHGHLLTHLT